MTSRTHGAVPGYGYCECGHMRFLDSASARRAKRKQRGRGHLNVFPCGGWWHVGHLDKRVIAGKVDRATAYRHRYTSQEAS